MTRIMFVIGTTLIVTAGCGTVGGVPDKVEVVPWDTMSVCNDQIAIIADHASGTSSTDGYLWPGISKNGHLVAHGPVRRVQAGQFSVDSLLIVVSEEKVVSGEYEIGLYLSIDSATVGDASSRVAVSESQYITLEYNNSIDQCIDVTLGDSVYFAVQFVGGIASIVKLDSAPEHDSYTWNSYFRKSSVDTTYLKPLRGYYNSLFFPLKLTNVENGFWWSVAAWNGPNLIAHVEIEVRVPTALGSTYNDWDEQIIFWSEIYEFPPQVIKALISKECTFRDSLVRYEMEHDAINIQANWEFKDEFALYLLADSAREGSRHAYDISGDSIQMGDSVPGLEIDPYWLLRNKSLATVNILDMDHDNLIEANELHALNPTPFPAQDDDFVSQIILESSYGALQDLQVSKIYFDSFGVTNPQLLLDRDLGIAWGCEGLRILMETKVNPTYSWFQKLRTMIGKHNGGPNATETNAIFGKTSVEEYTQDVLNRVQTFQPTR